MYIQQNTTVKKRQVENIFHDLITCVPYQHFAFLNLFLHLFLPFCVVYILLPKVKSLTKESKQVIFELDPLQ